MIYTPNKKSVRCHKVPDWFHDAKIGIFIHWGLYSVPSYACSEKGKDMNEIIKEKGYKELYKNNPYAEWYLNSLRIQDTPTQKYHKKTYGDDFSYDDFIPIFNEAIKKWDPNEMAEIFKKIGAKYVVLVTKHHDGFLLWPSKYPNPKKENYTASRDIVGELTEAVKKRGIIMGLYYSGGLDWSFNPNPIIDVQSMLLNIPKEIEYTNYVNNHWYELIDRYEPIILWNDIGYPPNTNLYQLFAYFYNKFPEGVVNNRWRQVYENKPKFPIVKHCDFRTPEYENIQKIKKYKWELCRGIGKSFGYNRFEIEENYLTGPELIHLFVDVVSKNGNLLLNVGPMADGTIPDIQKSCILELGKWLEMNGEAIYKTRPWTKSEGLTSTNIEVRYTKNSKSLFAILLGKPIGEKIEILSLVIDQDSKVELLSTNLSLEWKQENDNLTIIIPENIPDLPAYSFKITPFPSGNIIDLKKNIDNDT